MQKLKKKIYLIRHGQTDYNLKGIVQGSRVDTDLNETGFLQAQKFFEKYKDVSFDKIYTSKLKRTIQSVQPFINKGIPYESFEGLNEISWGDQDGQVTNTLMHDYYVKVSNEWQSGNLDLPIGGGESPNEVLKRQIPVLEYILKKDNEETILICMHGRAMRILMCHLTGKSLTEMDTFQHANLCLYLIEFNEKDINILKYNNLDHLT